jgi:hypothetical protein
MDGYACGSARTYYENEELSLRDREYLACSVMRSVVFDFAVPFFSLPGYHVIIIFHLLPLFTLFKLI